MTDIEVRRLFVERLNEWMEDHGIRKHQLAKMMGIPWHTMHAWTIGRSMPSFLLLRDLAKTTGMSTDWWMGLDIEEQQ